jgi:hypothetical protein
VRLGHQDARPRGQLPHGRRFLVLEPAERLAEAEPRTLVIAGLQTDLPQQDIRLRREPRTPLGLRQDAGRHRALEERLTIDGLGERVLEVVGPLEPQHRPRVEGERMVGSFEEPLRALEP